MNALWKLIVPIALGLGAGGINWFIMQDKPVPQAYAVAKEDLHAGQRFRETSVGQLMVPVEANNAMPKTAVRYMHRDTFFGRQATRDIKKGDLLLWQDSTQPGWELSARPDEEALPISLDGLSSVPRLIRVGDQVGFLVATQGSQTSKATGKAKAEGAKDDTDLDYVGPFRVLSVGERISREGDKKGEGRSSDDRVITVATQLGPDKKIDEKTRRYLLAKAGDKNSGSRVVALVLHSSHKAEERGGPIPGAGGRE